MSLALMAHLSLDLSAGPEVHGAAVLGSTGLEDWFEAVLVAPQLAYPSSTSPSPAEAGILEGELRLS